MNILSTRMRNYYAFALLDTSCEKDPDITVYRSPRTCFTIHMLQNKELLSQKQWHLKIGYADRTVSFNAFQMVYHVTIVIENCTLKKKKTLTGPAQD